MPEALEVAGVEDLIFLATVAAPGGGLLVYGLGVTGAVDRSAVPCGRGATPGSAAAQLVRARNAPVSIHQLWLNASSLQRLARAPRV